MTKHSKMTVAERNAIIPELLERLEEIEKRVSELAFDQVSTKSQPDSDGWIPWHGGECPVSDGVLVDIRMRNGETRLLANGSTERWSHHDEAPRRYDIIAYRLAKQETEWPQVGADFYYIDSDGKVEPQRWDGSVGDCRRRDFLGVYPTPEQAEEAAGKIKRVMEHWKNGGTVDLIPKHYGTIGIKL